ncbi:TadE family protein [Streptomyces sp. NPDC057136]|uniref:TadE family protein n=1 Tax=Streptomyces sp. NPDC057136 TaxID=3346029 RepID=UPI0036421690
MRPHPARPAIEDIASTRTGPTHVRTGPHQARPAIEDKTSTRLGLTQGRRGQNQARPALEDKAARRFRGDRGQAAIEFTGTLPLILITLALLWQAAMVGYTFMLAGNAADKAVTAATTVNGSALLACEQAGREDLPSAWDANFNCHASGDLMTARVDVQVPLLFPGAFNTPMTLTGEASANLERSWGW